MVKTFNLARKFQNVKIHKDIMFNILKRISSINAHQGKQSGNQHKLHLVSGICHGFSMSHTLFPYQGIQTFRQQTDGRTSISGFFVVGSCRCTKISFRTLSATPKTPLWRAISSISAVDVLQRHTAFNPFLATETFPQGWHFPAISTVASVWTVWVSR